MYFKRFNLKKVKSLMGPFFGIVFIIPLWFGGTTIKAQGTFSFKNNRTHYSLPFEFNRNLIIIPLMINNQGPYKFIFDTGVSIMVITNPDIPQKLGIKPSKSIILRGFGNGDNIKAQIISGLTFKIGPIFGNGFDAAVIPPGILEFSNYVGIPIDGIIGYDLVKDFRMSINYNYGLIKFDSPKKTFLKRNYIPIPLELEGSQAYIKVEAVLNGNTLPLNLVLDTGGGNSVFIDPRSIDSSKVPKKGPKTNLGWGINGSIEGIICRLNQLSLNSLIIKDVICAFPFFLDTIKYKNGINGNGNIGNEILSRFTLVIDYNHSKIYLKKHSSFNAPFDFDMSGITLSTLGSKLNQYFISSLDPNSPGEQAGLMEGDQIITIDGNLYGQYTLGELDALFKSGDRRKITLGVFRKGAYISTVLTLKRRV